MRNVYLIETVKKKDITLKNTNLERYKYQQRNISDTEDSDSEIPQKVFKNIDENPNYNEIPKNNYDREK